MIINVRRQSWHETDVANVNAKAVNLSSATALLGVEKVREGEAGDALLSLRRRRRRRRRRGEERFLLDLFMDVPDSVYKFMIRLYRRWSTYAQNFGPFHYWRAHAGSTDIKVAMRNEAVTHMQTKFTYHFPKHGVGPRRQRRRAQFSPRPSWQMGATPSFACREIKKLTSCLWSNASLMNFACFGSYLLLSTDSASVEAFGHSTWW